MKTMQPFQFKQFSIHQQQAAMKVGTDGILLGAWAFISDDTQAILDIGTGTGLLSLMMAQRCEAQIDGVEIDELAYVETVENFEGSPWADRLFCYYSTIQQFAKTFSADGETFDMIVSNPPYFTNGKPSKNLQRDTARNQCTLSFEDLLQSVSLLLANTGNFQTIIPYTQESTFLKLAKTFGLMPKRLCRVRGNKKSKLSRSLLELGFTKTENVSVSEIVLEKKQNVYSDAYISLTKDFYLNM